MICAHLEPLEIVADMSGVLIDVLEKPNQKSIAKSRTACEQRMPPNQVKEAQRDNCGGPPIWAEAVRVLRAKTLNVRYESVSVAFGCGRFAC